MKSLGAALIVFLVCSGLAHAQRLESFGRGSQPKNDEALIDDVAGEFNFVRVRFDTYFSGGGFRGGFGDGPWAIDFPDADTNFLRGVSRLTNIRVMSEPIVLEFDDPEIFDYPFLYMLEVGQGGGHGGRVGAVDLPALGVREAGALRPLGVIVVVIIRE